MVELDNLNPKVLQNMKLSELVLLSEQIRKFMIKSVSKTGGHIGANLGVIELTVGLHHVFNSPNDKIIFDTGHQGYAHKIITGRANKLGTLNQPDGMSRFIARSESEHDIIDASHAGTSLSIASGIAYSNLKRNINKHVIAIIGDGSLVEGLAFEGLNFIPVLPLKLIIILNDNGMAIAPNIGGIKNLTTGKGYINKSKAFFEALGLKYLHVSDGHDISELVEKYEIAKKAECPTIIHVKTEKGKGLPFSKDHPYKMHFSMPFNPKDGTGASPTISGKTYATVASEELKNQLEKDNDIVLITPATPYASSLDDLIREFPDRIIDVGMAEQHSVVMACGMALEGLKPVLCIQTTFLQRAFDQLLHDVCFMNLPVTILGVRSGFAGLDSSTHHGLYDIPYLRSLPNMQISYPVNSGDLKDIINERLLDPVGPMVILHPYENVPDNEIYDIIEDDKFIRLVNEGEDGIVFCLGNQLNQAIELRQKIFDINNQKFSVACVRSVKPLNEEKIIDLCKNKGKIITIEESTLPAGFGSAINEVLIDNDIFIPLLRVGITDRFVPIGDKSQLSKLSHIDANGIYDTIVARWSDFKK